MALPLSVVGCSPVRGYIELSPSWPGVDAGVLACVDEPWNDDALDEEEEALREADWEADALGAPRPPAVDAADEEVSPAGEGVGVDGFPRPNRAPHRTRQHWPRRSYPCLAISSRPYFIGTTADRPEL
jgi:hypothetical protein